MKQELIPQPVIQLLWQRFALKLPQTTVQEQRGAINILSMIAGAEIDIIKTNLSVLIEHGLTYKSNNFLLARDTCSAILKINGKKKTFGGSAEPYRLPTDHTLFTRLETMILEGLARLSDMTWVPFSENALSVIYQLAERPDVITGRILKSLVKALFNVPQSSSADESARTNESQPGNFAIFFSLCLPYVYFILNEMVNLSSFIFKLSKYYLRPRPRFFKRNVIFFM